MLTCELVKTDTLEMSSVHVCSRSVSVAPDSTSSEHKMRLPMPNKSQNTNTDSFK